MRFINKGATVKIDENHSKVGGMVGTVVHKRTHKIKENKYLVKIYDDSEKKKGIWIKESLLGVW